VPLEDGSRWLVGSPGATLHHPTRFKARKFFVRDVLFASHRADVCFGVRWQNIVTRYWAPALSFGPMLKAGVRRSGTYRTRTIRRHRRRGLGKRHRFRRIRRSKPQPSRRFEQSLWLDAIPSPVKEESTIKSEVMRGTRKIR